MYRMRFVGSAKNSQNNNPESDIGEYNSPELEEPAAISPRSVSAVNGRPVALSNFA